MRISMEQHVDTERSRPLFRRYAVRILAELPVTLTPKQATAGSFQNPHLNRS